MTHTTATNPLLQGRGLPAFDKIQPTDVELAVTTLVQELEAQLTELEKSVQPTWEGLVEPLTALEEKLSWTWGTVSHLMGVKNSPELRHGFEQVQPLVVGFISRLGQSRPLYEAFVALRGSAEWEQLEPAQQRIVESNIREAELGGVGLTGENREKFNAIQLELAELATKFSNNVLDASQAFELKLTDKEEIAGLPASLLALAAQTAQQKGEENATAEDGPWVMTLDYPSYLPFMKYSQREDLREKVYRAFIRRAADGQWDNHPLIERILELRLEKAQLLGFDTYAELSLSRKMAPDVAAVEKLLEELRVPSYKAAAQEFADLQKFAGVEELHHWDTAYWSERQREQEFDFDAEALRPYFPLPQVLEGLFALAKRLFGVTIQPSKDPAPVWHPDVQFFQVLDESETAIASFYLDAYSRPAEKRGGAWMADCLNRGQELVDGQKSLRLPVAYLICNQTPPVGDQPSLMTFYEVTTLFHEFGHGLQHLLTTVNYSGAAGINNVEWDAVELPSQFMENWCYDPTTLFSLAKHYQTGETLPQAEYEKILATRNFMTGSAMLRQINFSLLDLELHHRYRPDGPETIEQIGDRLAKITTILRPLPENAFLCSFGHIFAGGYAAGYYSYKWAEVLSADAFAAFEEVGLDDEAAVQTTGKRFRETVLALGGSLAPAVVFEKFRGRQPQTAPLLRHNGLLPSAI
ncbi:M3 family metallopeptidase [Synechocystis salina LEGE 06099]|uniref:M3 family metallopeptidase n=1 Tax=Synechocystis salina TaxID=945780 RepID=UPI00187DDDAD|nr:M3 family metallopeptidase [Synechocystis salina]MBE9204074.1 M3 family metallopeptidase [Synechocystis salina LEGE 06099]